MLPSKIILNTLSCWVPVNKNESSLRKSLSRVASSEDLTIVLLFLAHVRRKRHHLPKQANDVIQQSLLSTKPPSRCFFLGCQQFRCDLELR